MTATAPTLEQRRAAAETDAVAREAVGALLRDVAATRMDAGFLVLRLWLWSECLSPTPDGEPLDLWEGVDVGIPDDFPFSPPNATSLHTRFSGLPHVQWGRHLCLYASQNDWDPASGMRGFLERLVAFYERVGRGDLEGPLIPWHPPVADGLWDDGIVVVKGDLAEHDLEAGGTHLRWAVAAQTGPNRVDILDWLDNGELPERLGDVSSRPMVELLRYRSQDAASAVFLAPAVALSAPIAFEYPRTAMALLTALEEFGIPTGQIVARLAYATLLNSALAETAEDGGTYGGPDVAEPPLLLIRAPASRHGSKRDRRAHFAIWRVPIDDVLAAHQMLTATSDADRIRQLLELHAAPVNWIPHFDARPGAVARRDSGKPVQKLLGRRVLVLGCGALGAPIAEHCMRAGASEITVVDNSLVTPGLLVRQPYEESDIGRPKAQALAGRLLRTRPDARVRFLAGDALDLVTPEGLQCADLVVDATASVVVRTKIERLLIDTRHHWPDLLTVLIGQEAVSGLAAVTPTGTVGGGVDLLRRVRLELGLEEEFAGVVEEFFPDRIDFQPEPGCSEPTFVGSTTDVGALAALLLDAALERLDPTEPARNLSVVRTSGRARAHRRVAEDVRLRDRQGFYDVRVHPAAMSRLLGATAVPVGVDPALLEETGGLLLGQMDAGCGVLWVTEAIVSPPGSFGSPMEYVLDPRGVQDEIQELAERNKGLLDFVGVWHSHPNSPALPSERDTTTMLALTRDERAPRSALLLVLGQPFESAQSARTAPAHRGPWAAYAEVFSPVQILA